jgi:HEAT repeat protein
LDKLNKAQDSHEEKALLGALYVTPSHLSTDGLLERARSPKLATRTEAIRALEKLGKLNKNAEKALIDDIVNNPFTTAYISARTLGNHQCTSAIPKLRELSGSEDYMLAGESIIALAKMKDEEFRPEIEKIILNTQNPRLIIMGAEALGLFHNYESVQKLLDILRGKNPPQYLRDEIILAIAAIIDTQNKFYKILARYSSDNSLCVTLAMDEVEAAIEFVKTALSKKKKKVTITVIAAYAESFQNAVSSYVRENNGTELSRWILELPDEYSRVGSAIKSVFSETIIDEGFMNYDCLRLLIVHWAAQELRFWAAKAK